MSTHDNLAALCGDRIGIGVSHDHIKELFEGVVKAYQASDIVTKGMPIRTTCVGVSPALASVPIFNIDNPRGIVVFDSFKATIKIHDRDDPKVVFSKLTFEYPEFECALSIAGKENRIRLNPDKIPEPGTPTSSGNPSTALLKKYFNGSLDEYKRLELFIQISAAPLIPGAVLDNFRFPDIVRALRTFNLTNPTIVFEDNYLVVTSKHVSVSAAKPNCPDGPNAKHEVSASRATLTEIVDDDGADDSSEYLSSKSHTGESTIIHKPEEPDQPSTWVNGSPYVLYIPQHPLHSWASDVFKPSLSANDSDRNRSDIPLVYWEWFATVALVEGTAGFDTIPTGGLRLTASAYLDIFGHAGAGIEIGCVKWEVMGA